MILTIMGIFLLLSLIFFLLKEENDVTFGKNYFIGTVFLILGISMMFVVPIVDDIWGVNAEKVLKGFVIDVWKSFL